MIFYDVFNGDADGICALHQLRLADPRPDAHLISGVKRDIRLLDRLIEVKGATVTVLDISMNSNQSGLKGLLENDCRIFYVDHHFAGDIPNNKLLEHHIDPDPEVCTSLIVDRLLTGRYRGWAIAAAFGDNLHETALKTAADTSLSNNEIAKLKELGELLNYNGYGASIDDLHFPPQEIYKAVRPYENPLDFHDRSEVLARLRQGFHDDISLARSFAPAQENKAGRIFELPPEPWAKRVSGVFSNEKAREKPDMAHALLVKNQDNTYRISVRAPLNNKTGADTLCLQFPTGGGRTGAAGINNLPPESLENFFASFTKIFS